MIARFSSLPLLAALCLLPLPAASQDSQSADSRLSLPLNDAAWRSSLIIRARVELVNGKILYRPLDTLHGVLDYARFQGKAPAGYLDLYRRDAEKSEMILFFTGADRIRSYTWHLPIANGKISYRDKAYTPAEFKDELHKERSANAIPLEELVPKCSLILHCKTAVAEGLICHKVLEVPKGSLAKVTFLRPAPEGHLNLGANVEGVEMILCYYGTEKLHRQDAVIPIRDGKILFRGQQLRVDQFLAQVRKVAGQRE
jgi:hypothetical protein